MQEKVRYQYTYFIYPFTAKKYENYLYSLLKEKQIKVELLEKEKDMELYTYFLPSVRDYFFESMNWEKEQKKAFEEMDENEKKERLAKMGCCLFSYQLENQVHGKIGEGDIFFSIDKIQILCTKNINFLLLKTQIENVETVEQVLDFNYKFREINTIPENLKSYEKIHIQTTQFETLKEMQSLIQELTKQETIPLPYVHSYLCIDSQYWNKAEDFSKLQLLYQKYSSLQPKGENSSMKAQPLIVLDKDYGKMASSKQGNFLMTSSIQNENYTKFPYYFEKQYLYTYLIRLQQKHTLQDSFEKVKVKENWEAILARDEITEEETGEKLYQTLKQIENIDVLEQRAKQYQELQFQKEEIAKNKKWNRILLVILCISFILNIVNLIMNVVLR